MNIGDVDLNLLQTFHAVHAERSVSRDATRLGLPQPTVSHALKRLRLVLSCVRTARPRALKNLGLSANIRLSMPHFMVLPRILAETDLAVVMPARLADVFRAMGDYAVWRPSVGLPAFDVSVHWSWRYAGDPGARRLRERIVALFGERETSRRARG